MKRKDEVVTSFSKNVRNARRESRLYEKRHRSMEKTVKSGGKGCFKNGKGFSFEVKRRRKVRPSNSTIRDLLGNNDFAEETLEFLKDTKVGHPRKTSLKRIRMYNWIIFWFSVSLFCHFRSPPLLASVPLPF